MVPVESAWPRPAPRLPLAAALPERAVQTRFESSPRGSMRAASGSSSLSASSGRTESEGAAKKRPHSSSPATSSTTPAPRDSGLEPPIPPSKRRIVTDDDDADEAASRSGEAPRSHAGSSSSAMHAATLTTIQSVSHPDDDRMIEYGPLFEAELPNAALVLAGLKGIANGKREQQVTVHAKASEGLFFSTLDSSKTLQGTSKLSADIFTYWRVVGPDQIVGEEEEEEEPSAAGEVSFTLSLAVLVDSLSVFSPSFSFSSSSLGANSAQHHITTRFSYTGEALTVELTAVDVVHTCRLRAIDPGLEDVLVPPDPEGEDAPHDEPMQQRASRDDRLTFAKAFASCAFINRFILDSARLRECFAELDELPGASVVTIVMSPDEPYFKMSTKGDGGMVEVSIPKGDAPLKEFDCKHCLSFDFRLASLTQAARPLSEATRTNFRLNSNGMLSIDHVKQFQLHGKTVRTYVQYYCTSNDVL